MPQPLCIFEDRGFVEFFPISLSQAVFDLRVGAGTLRSRWSSGATKGEVSLVCRDYLAESVRLSSAGVAVNAPCDTDTLFVNARWLCFGKEADALLSKLGANTVALQAGSIVAARVDRSAAAAFATYLRSHLSDVAVNAACERLKSNASAASESSAVEARDVSPELLRLIDARGLKKLDARDARLLAFPWQLIEHNASCIRDDFERAAANGGTPGVHSGVTIVAPERVVIGKDAALRPGVVIDASAGPVLIGDRVLVMPNATIVGPVSIGAGSVVKAGARILSGTSIGSTCKVGGEVDETIFADYSNKQHDGFLGHSYIGAWVNIGAATNNSDLKNNYGTVRMWCAGRARDTGRQFLGLVMGDHTKIGISAVFNTGTVVGFNCNLYSSETPDAFVPSFSWGHGREIAPYHLAKAIETAALAMQRRGVTFADVHRRLFERVHDMVARSGRSA